MRIKVVGRLRQDYTLDGGYTFHGVKYFGVVLDEEQEGLQGCQTTDIKIPDGSPHSAVPLELDRTYIVYFNKKGAVDFVRPDDGAPSSFDVFIEDEEVKKK